jgi:hypothetical protein
MIVLGAASASAAAPEYGRCLRTTHGKFKDAGCTTPAKPGEERYEWYAGFGGPRPIEKAKFTMASTSLVRLESTSGIVWTCLGETAAGAYTGAKTLSISSIKLSGCEFSGVSCNSAGDRSGEITTVPVVGMLGVYKLGETAAKNLVGLELSAASGEQIWEAACGPLVMRVKGHLILPQPVNQMELSVTVKDIANKGRNTPEEFVGGPKAVLEVSLSGTAYEQLGISFASVTTNEEKIEISTVN